MDDNQTPSPSLRSLRSNRTTTGNDNLRRSCLLSRSANPSQNHSVQIVTFGDENAASAGCSAANNLPQRRCQSLGKFPANQGPSKAAEMCDNTGQSSCGSSSKEQHFLRVPQVFPESDIRSESSRRIRKESKSLDAFPVELRPPSAVPSDRSSLHADAERTRLLDDQDIYLTIPDADGQPMATTNCDPQSGNGNDCKHELKNSRQVHYYDDNVGGSCDANVNCQPVPARRKAGAVTVATDERTDEKRWHSTQDLMHPDATMAGGEHRKRDSTPMVAVNRSVKQWLVSLFAVGPRQDSPKNASSRANQEIREEGESFV